MRVFSRCLICAWIACAAGAAGRAARGAEGAGPADAPPAVERPAEGLPGDEVTDADREALVSDVPLALDPVTVMRLTVRFSPEIARAFERKAAEEARYDFFIASRSALSYGMGAAVGYDRYHVGPERYLEKTLGPEVFLRKDFYNTAQASLSTGYFLDDYQDGHNSDAFLRATVSVPLFASREALQRSNDKIFQQNEVNDARLSYYREIRSTIRHALESLAWAQLNQERLGCMNEHLADVEELLNEAKSITDRDTSADQLKLAAIIASTGADINGARNRLNTSVSRLKLTMGIPFQTMVELAETEFNPFQGEGEERLCKIALETDEEMKTLLNSIKSAQLELALARKGKWDTSLFLSGRRNFAGGGGLQDQGSYSLATGVEVRKIDSRISRSLENIALANIREFTNAREGRMREILTETMEACITLASQLEEVQVRVSNLARYWESYSKGIELYDSGHITIDELIQKRQEILSEQEQISESRNLARENVANLLASTGRYEQFVNGEPPAAEGAPEGPP